MFGFVEVLVVGGAALAGAMVGGVQSRSFLNRSIHKAATAAGLARAPYSGTFDGAGFLVSGRRHWVSVFPESRFIHMEVSPLNASAGVGFTVALEALPTFKRWVGIRDIEVGDPIFDDAWHIKGAPEDHVRGIFAAAPVRDLLAGLRDPHGAGLLTRMELVAGAVVLTITWDAPGPRRFQRKRASPDGPALKTAGEERVWRGQKLAEIALKLSAALDDAIRTAPARLPPALCNPGATSGSSTSVALPTLDR